MARKLSVYVILLALVFGDFPEENDVLVLTESNFSSAIETHKQLLVEFYAPWCGHCKQLEPEYTKAASILKARDPPIRVAKTDATENVNLSQEYGVLGFPTLIYFINQQPIQYTGGRDAASIVSWVLKKAGFGVKTIGGLITLKEEIASNKVSVVLFVQAQSNEEGVFQFVARSFDDPEFIISTDPAALEEYSVKEPQLVIFKTFDEGRNDFSGNWNTMDITKFIEDNMRPSLMLFDEEAINLIFQDSNPGILVFRGEQDAGKIDPFLKKLGKEMKGVLVMTYIDLNEPETQRIGEFFGISIQDMPAALILDSKENAKYKIEGDINEDNTRTFIQAWENQELEMYFKSEAIPQEPLENGVTKIVGKNFNAIVNDENKDVLVEFYAPWCGHCQEFAPEYEKLAEHFKGSQHVLITKIDAASNEIPDHPIRGFPTFKYFPANNKEGLDYEGDRTLNDLKDFIIKHGSTERVKTDL